MNLLRYIQKIIIIFSFSNLCAQNDWCIQYKVSTNVDYENIKLVEVKNMMLDVESEIEKFEFELLIKNGISSFNKKKSIDNASVNINVLNIASAMCYADQVWYYDSVTNTRICYREIFGEKFIINLLEPRKWILTEEKKKIGDYIAYKATTERIYVGSKGLNKGEVEVWYTPDIPINNGPLGFAGLPGLIIELSMQKITYHISNIKKINIKNIEKPTRGIIITEDEFFKMAEEKVADFRSSYGRD